MKGFVPTPQELVDAMVGKLFEARRPVPGDSVLDPGCGTGPFIQGILRWCHRNGLTPPSIVGVDSDPVLVARARQSLQHEPRVRLEHRDFLAPTDQRFDFIIGNPPYVPITGLSTDERAAYRRSYLTATGRFDLYLLFFEQAIRLLKPDGRLVFVTPEKYLYVQTAGPLRRELARIGVEEIHLIPEQSFGDLVTYPTITSLAYRGPVPDTRIRLRDGTVRQVRLTDTGSSWQPLITGNGVLDSGPSLADAFLKISCGVATGADDVFVLRTEHVPVALLEFAKPTLSGRSLTPEKGIEGGWSMLVPYNRSGALLAEAELGALGDYLRDPGRFAKLMRRTCVARKPWYAFHENPPLSDILRPKILCKDISSRPWFIVEEDGGIVPRHSLYYLVPTAPGMVHELCDYLNSPPATDWLMAHCQRAANGFLRLQSHVLKKLPLPERFLSEPQLAYA